MKRHTRWLAPTLSIAVVILVTVLAIFTMRGSASAVAASENKPQTGKLRPPADGKKIRVAFVLTEGATMIDFAGPWEVFQDVNLGTSGKTVRPFELYTVGESKEPIRTSGGMTIVPDYTFADAPGPKIVVVPAQSGAPALADWLRRMDKESDVVMSVCTGAYILGEAGLLDGKRATSHHEFIDQLQKAFPKTTWVKGARYVQSDDVVYTAGGLTSGIDLALYIVEEYYGRDVAQKTAEYMEYHGQN